MCSILTLPYLCVPMYNIGFFLVLKLKLLLYTCVLLAELIEAVHNIYTNTSALHRHFSHSMKLA